MYESPIQLTETQLRTEIENEIFRAIKEVGVDVNKEQLIKALQYDRHQYSKGYKDGYDDSISEFAERLKEELRLSTGNNGGFVPSMIDNLVKEMAGDTNEQHT